MTRARETGPVPAGGYVYRRALTGTDFLMAGGVAAGVAAASFYLVCLVLQRAPLDPEPPFESARSRPRARRKPKPVIP